MSKNIFRLLMVFTFLQGTLYAQEDLSAVVQSKANSFTVGNKAAVSGSFINVKDPGGVEFRSFVAGPEDSKVGVLLIHDYFGITSATKEVVEQLGALGYRAIAVDLYKGKSATTNDSASFLLGSKDSAETVHILQAGINYLKKPGRKLVAIGYSAGGIDAMNATLLEPELFGATIIVYGGGYDKIEHGRLEKLNNPVLAITGSLDEWAFRAGINFLSDEKDKSFEFFVYPRADHGYAQPLFNGGRNYNSEATRISWMLIKEFILQNTMK